MTDSSALALSLSNVSKAFEGLARGRREPRRRGRKSAARSSGRTARERRHLFSLISGETSPDRRANHPLWPECHTCCLRTAAPRWGSPGRIRSPTSSLNLTVLENCLLAVQALTPAKLHPAPRCSPATRIILARARSVLEAVGLQGKRITIVRNLSHGEQRQLEIALALAGIPALLLLDEPTAGLSPAESHHHDRPLLKKLDTACACWSSSMIWTLPFELTDRITVLHYGKVIADGLKSNEVQAPTRIVQGDLSRRCCGERR